ncbi:MAG: serine/threonine-protein kinase [Planctomycetota bacterium]|nr:serine/threonine-protein kinase [Planctomycetota bacterium]
MKELKDQYEFRIIRALAEGGMGMVYEAVQLGAEGFEKTVALKVLLEELSSDSEFVSMFIGEAKLVADLVHQHIVQIYQLGSIENRLYIAMEYIHGINLRDFIDRHRELGQDVPVEIAVYIMSRVARGLEYAHHARDKAGDLLGVVHRDISPANIMVTFQGVVKITDFGIAKAANLMRDQEGEVLMGKLRYMSPEQAEYKHTDKRSDIFSAGILLYELLGNKPLFEETDTQTTLKNVVEMAIPSIRSVNPKVPQEVERILGKILERDLEKRYQDCGHVAYDLEYYMYNNRFGPTMVTLENYLHTLYPNISQRYGGPPEKRDLGYDPNIHTIYLRELEESTSKERQKKK